AEPAAGGSFPWLTRYPPGVNWHQAFKPVPVQELLDTTAKAHPRRTCTNFLGKTLTYGAIAALVDRTAAGLQKLGVGKGSKVGLFLPNSPTFIIYYYAILKTGGTVV